MGWAYADGEKLQTVFVILLILFFAALFLGLFFLYKLLKRAIRRISKTN